MDRPKLYQEPHPCSPSTPLPSLRGSRLQSAMFSSRLLVAWIAFIVIFSPSTPQVEALSYTPGYEDYNLNQNVSAKNPLEYWGEWPGHSYHPSPQNWRMPFYTLFLDRFVNGDPSNDNANGTLYEHDPTSSILRHGGDINGLVDSLDYLQGKQVQSPLDLAQASNIRYGLCCTNNLYGLGMGIKVCT